MTRTDYLTARRLCRDNGPHALTWMRPALAAVVGASLYGPIDPLAARALLAF